MKKFSRENKANSFKHGEIVLYIRDEEEIIASVHHIGHNSVCIKFTEKEEEKFYWANPDTIIKLGRD